MGGQSPRQGDQISVTPGEQGPKFPPHTASTDHTQVLESLRALIVVAEKFLDPAFSLCETKRGDRRVPKLLACLNTLTRTRPLVRQVTE